MPGCRGVRRRRRRAADRGALSPARAEPALGTRSESLGSRVLRLQTLESLGGAEQIVRTHLDATMRGLPEATAGRRGAGLPLSRDPVGDEDRSRRCRSRRAHRSPEERLEPVLCAGSRPARCASCRPVGDGEYEIYHDALAGPILDWRARWEEHQRRRRWRLRAAFVSSAAIMLGRSRSHPGRSSTRVTSAISRVRASSLRRRACSSTATQGRAWTWPRRRPAPLRPGPPRERFALRW